MMKGKTCVVTGADSGIGFVTAKRLAAMGARLLLLCRTEHKGQKTLEEIRRTTGNPALELFATDLASQRKIREVGAHIREKHPVLDVLVNNAGTFYTKYSVTEEGIETVFAVNHLAYVLLTHLLYPSLRKADDARIINVSSDNHFMGRIHFDDLNLSGGYHGLRSYAQSKLANVMFTVELHRRKPDPHLTVNALHPGLVYTDIGLKHTTWLQALIWKIRRSVGHVKTASEGAATSVFLASAREVRGKSGLYWDDCHPKPYARAAHDPEQTTRLWETSLQLCRIHDFFIETSQ